MSQLKQLLRSLLAELIRIKINSSGNSPGGRPGSNNQFTVTKFLTTLVMFTGFQFMRRHWSQYVDLALKFSIFCK